MLNLSLSNFFMHCRSLKSKGGPRYSRFPNFPGTKHPRIARETCIVILIFHWPFCRRRRATWSPPSWLGWAMLTPEVRRPFFITKPRGRWCQREGRRHSGTTSIGKAIEIREHTTEAAPSSRERNGFSTSGSSTSIRFKHFHVDCTLKLDHFMNNVRGHSNNTWNFFGSFLTPPPPPMWHLTFSNNCFERPLDTVQKNELERKCLSKHNLALSKMTFYS